MRHLKLRLLKQLQYFSRIIWFLLHRFTIGFITCHKDRLCVFQPFNHDSRLQETARSSSIIQLIVTSDISILPSEFLSKLAMNSFIFSLNAACEGSCNHNHRSKGQYNNGVFNLNIHTYIHTQEITQLKICKLSQPCIYISTHLQQQISFVLN